MEKLKDLLESSSLPGVPIIIKSNHKIVTFIWFISLFSLITLSTYYISESINEYLSYKVITNIDLINESQSEFPMISFCINNNNNIESNLLENIMFYCYFDTIKCNWTDFEVYTSQRSEICYQFNTGKNVFNVTVDKRYMTRQGIDAGLIILFKIKYFKLSFVTHNINPYKMSIHIQNRSNLFLRERIYNIESDGIQLSNGFSYIQIERDLIQKLSKPYSQCVKQDTSEYVSKLFQYFIQNNKTYLQKDCLDLCIDQLIKQKCNCTDEMGEINNCLDKLLCIANYYNQFMRKLIKLSDTMCLSDCPIECDSIQFRVHANYVGIIPKEYLIDNNLPIDLLENGILINIFYPQLKYTFLNQIQKTEPFDLASNVGGILGLFIGFSFFTFIELIEIIFELIFYFINRI